MAQNQRYNPEDAMSKTRRIMERRDWANQSARRLDISLNFVMGSSGYFFPGTKVK